MPPLVQLPALEVVAGERIALTGPSGVGKSTLLRGLVRLQPCEAASFTVRGEEATGWSVRQLRQQLVYLPQVPQSLSESVWEDCRLTLSFQGRVPADWKAQAAAALRQAGLAEEHWETDAGRLSVGQRMRLALARAMLMSPALLLLDETFAPLDPVSQVAVQAVLREWLEQGDRALIFVAHDVALTQTFATVRWELTDSRTLHRSAVSAEATA
ncbi:MAG: Glycine betaine transport ATP-binding protein OpuAA [bacterium]|nr:Glycine betaine transport ATP-binding protein OpuAA [bacterium]